MSRGVVAMVFSDDADEDAEEEDAVDLVWQGSDYQKASSNPNDVARAEKSDEPIKEKYESKYEEPAEEE